MTLETHRTMSLPQVAPMPLAIDQFETALTELRRERRRQLISMAAMFIVGVAGMTLFAISFSPSLRSANVHEVNIVLALFGTAAMSLSAYVLLRR